MTNTITCARCGAQNPADARYCDQCSLPLQAQTLPAQVPQPAAPFVSRPPPPPTPGLSVPLPPIPLPTERPAGATLQVANSKPQAGGPPVLLIGAAVVLLVVFLVGGGILLGGTMANGAPPTAGPTPNLQATIAEMMHAQATQQALNVPAGPSVTPLATSKVPTQAPTLPAPQPATLAPTQVATVAPTAVPPPAATAAPVVATVAPATPTPNGPTPTAVTVITLTMNALGGSGEHGTAVLTEEYDLGTRIVIQLSGAPTVPQPAHIHLGTCDNIAPKPSYPLKNVVNGRSETLLPISFSELHKGVYLINVHTSETLLEPYVACGEIR